MVAAQDGDPSLPARIGDAFALSPTELGRLFGVSRRTAANWLAGELPIERHTKATTIITLADLLTAHLGAEVLPSIARRPADAFGGRTMLEMIAADRHAELLALTRASFDFGRSA